MASAKPKITLEEFAAAFQTPNGPSTPAILSPKQFAAICGLSVKTVYEWIAQGRFDGAFRKRGKHNLIWRDKALEIIFNGKEW